METKKEKEEETEEPERLPGEQVDEEDDEGEDEPGGRHRADDAERLQVELGVRPEVIILQALERDVDMRHLAE
jgi:hypothetical protein